MYDRKMKSSASNLDPEAGKAETEPFFGSSPSGLRRPSNNIEQAAPLDSTPINIARSVLKSPFTGPADTELSILSSLSSPKLSTTLDPASHDKTYYDDRYNNSAFDPLLAVATLPKIAVSIAGMLLTGSILNRIIVRKGHFLGILILFRVGMYLNKFQSFLFLFQYC